MAIVSFTGFEQDYDGAECIVQSSDGVSIDQDAALSGGYGLHVSAGIGQDGHVLIGKPSPNRGILSVNLTACWFGFRVKLIDFDDEGLLGRTFAAVMQSLTAAKFYLKVCKNFNTGTGYIVRLHDAAGAVIWNWSWGDEDIDHYVEIFARNSIGNRQIWWDGVKVFDGVLPDGSGNVAYLALGRPGETGYATEMYYDDVYVDSTTRHGRLRVRLLQTRTEVENSFDAGGTTEVTTIPPDPESQVATATADASTLRISTKGVGAFNADAIAAVKLHCMTNSE